MASETIKITMLGTQSSGKTCYMLGMYAIMQMGKANFTLRATDLNVDVLLSRRWDTLVEERGQGRWPPPNVGETENYVFELSYGFKPIKQFQWLDYRGGALKDDASAKDVQQLKAHLLDSQGIFLCLSGQHLVEKLTETKNDRQQLSFKGTQIARKVGVEKMNWYLTEIQKTKNISEKNPFPVSIAITKYDLCAHRSKDEIIEDVKTVFSPLFTKNSGWFAAICPITLGRELAQDVDNASINPKGVENPLMFAIHTHFRNLLLSKQSNMQYYQGRSKDFKLRNPVYRLFNSKELDEIRRELGLAEKEATELQKNMQLVAKGLEDVPLYLSGEKEELDV